MRPYKFFSILAIIFLTLSSCGPIVISSRLDGPPPPWFYPNRLEVVRYMYFPEYSIYYDLTLRHYLYLNNGIWIRVNTLPAKYQNLDLKRSRYVRIKDYRSDNIRDYHNENNVRRTSNIPSRRRN